MDYAVRQATLEDYEGICALLQEADALHQEGAPHVFQKTAGPARPLDRLSKLIGSELSNVFVAVEGSRVIGVIQTEIRESPNIPVLVRRRYAYVDELTVAGTHRRRGIGRALVESALSWAKEKGIDQVELNVWEFNEGAIAFWESLGFVAASRRMWLPLHMEGGKT